MTLMVRPAGLFAPWGGGWDVEWFMVKAPVWRAATGGTDIRFLCVGCLERRLGRKLAARDFMRSAKVNFVGRKSPRLKRRMRGLRPARRLINTKFQFRHKQGPFAAAVARAAHNLQ
jgi:hypothetical protein